MCLALREVWEHDNDLQICKILLHRRRKPSALQGREDNKGLRLRWRGWTYEASDWQDCRSGGDYLGHGVFQNHLENFCQEWHKHSGPAVGQTTELCLRSLSALLQYNTLQVWQNVSSMLCGKWLKNTSSHCLYGFLSIFIPSSLQVIFKHVALSFTFSQQPGTVQGHLALDFQQLTYSPQNKMGNHLVPKIFVGSH